MVRHSLLVICAVLALSRPVAGQTAGEAGLRGTADVLERGTRAPRRPDRQPAGRTRQPDPPPEDELPPLPDPFEDYSGDAETGAPVNRSDVFRDLGNFDGSPEGTVPRPRPADPAAAGRQAGTGDDGTLLNPRAARASRVAPRAATGPVDSQTLPGGVLTDGPRAASDQPRSFPERESADAVFVEQESAYEPLGLRAGSFLILPSVTTTGGYTDNTDQASGGDPGAFYRISPQVLLRSDWSRHQLNGAFRGSFQGFPKSPDDNDPSASAEIGARIDAGRATTVNLGATYRLDRETQSDPDLTAADTEGVLEQAFGATAGVTRAVGLLGLTLRGSAERELFGESQGGLSADGSGAIVSPSDDRSNTEVLASLRLSLETDARLRPYVEASAGRREFDGDADALGFNRDSTIGELRAGLVVDMAPKILVDANLGYRREDVSDSTLEDLEGIVFDATMTWSPDRLTLVTVTGGTDFATTAIAGATGSITYSGEVGLRRALRDNLTLDAGVGLSYERFVGFDREDLTTTANAGLTWALNRNVALTAQYTYERLDSTAVAADFSANTVELGVRLQR